MAATLVKTDKNGTRYYESDDCPKCGGSGVIREYGHIEGGICFKCQGSGFFHHSWREMTQEYTERLGQLRLAREARKEAEFDANIAEHYKALGLTAEGHAFMVMDNTFGRKEELKVAGARFNGAFWYLPEAKDGWDTEEVDCSTFVWKDYKKEVVRWDENAEFDMKSLAKKFRSDRRTAENSKTPSEYFGAVGDRIQADVVIKDIISFNYIGYDGMEETLYVYKMVDDAGHHFTWVTANNFAGYAVTWFGSDAICHKGPEEIKAMVRGQKVVLRGTVKDQKVHEGLKETVLNRCKFTRAA